MSQHDNHSSSSGSFFNGLVLGGVLGAAAVFLLGTNRGKKVLKVLTEQGLQTADDIKELLDEAAEEVDDVTEAPIPPIDLKKNESQTKSGIATHTRRFFTRSQK